MKPWELMDSAAIPNSGGIMRLMRRGHELVIHVDDRELMRNTVHGSEDALAALVPAVVRWNRGPLAAVAGNPLADSRASVHDGDVAELIREPPQPWDAILLDVDNGPVGLTRATNDGLYSAQGLDEAFRALKPRGILAVWSAAPDPAFARRFQRAGFVVQSIALRSRGAQGGRRHVIWLGVRKKEGPKWQR